MALGGDHPANGSPHDLGDGRAVQVDRALGKALVSQGQQHPLYACQIYLGRDEAGKKQYKSIYAKSPAELKEKEAAVRLQLGRGLDLLSQRD